MTIVGNAGVVHIGAHLDKAAAKLGINASLCNSEEASFGSLWTRRLNWWLRGHRPNRLRVFSQSTVDACREFQPSWFITTGLAPIDEKAIVEIARLGIQRLNYLTDDPWNRAHRAPWFMEALPHYDHILSPRRANLEELRKAGCARVSYLPFAYAPEIHYPDPPASREEHERYSADVVFAGGADEERFQQIVAIIEARFRIALYGGYWERYQLTRKYSLGQAEPHTLRKAISGAKVSLCLVRRANRDGHSMRTFEVAAMGGCMLAEDTEEHREIFGPEGQAVMYFATTAEMIQKLRLLLGNPELRNRLARAARDRIVNGPNTYADRLATMLNLVSEPVA